MAQDFSRDFYDSSAWKATRKAYKKSVGNLCERCLKRGLYRPAVIVHHKTYLTPENLKDPHIALSWDNLEAVCRECHEEIHAKKRNRRYTINADGTVIIEDARA